MQTNALYFQSHSYCPNRELHSLTLFVQYFRITISISKRTWNKPREKCATLRTTRKYVSNNSFWLLLCCWASNKNKPNTRQHTTMQVKNVLFEKRIFIPFPLCIEHTQNANKCLIWIINQRTCLLFVRRKRDEQKNWFS